MNVNEIIMNKRIERGVSRKELAEGLGVSESTIYRIETNPNLNPNNKLVKRIYDILRMNVTIIVDDAPIYDEHIVLQVKVLFLKRLQKKKKWRN